MEELLLTVDEKMEAAFEALLNNFGKVRTGKASPAVLDDIKINYYGTPTPVKQLANINTPEPRQIIVQPWDKTTLADIEKAILAANIGVTPENDGNVIRLPFQALTEDKRKEIVKQVKKLGEDAKISVRNIRRDANEQAKKMKKGSEISEDDETRLLKEIQDKTDAWVKKIEESTKNKESEVLTV
jgi:ribosome recycling factor